MAVESSGLSRWDDSIVIAESNRVCMALRLRTQIGGGVFELAIGADEAFVV
jgi:hypothetical protein